MWFIVALLLIFRFGKENRVFYLGGAFFIFMAGCWLVRPLFGIDLLKGPASWGLRGITAVLLAVFCLAYYREIKNGKKDDGGKSVKP
jgi:drug/metabolite transporter (DMT)-like permease